jgi:hypothetical protein
MLIFMPMALDAEPLHPALWRGVRIVCKVDGQEILLIDEHCLMIRFLRYDERAVVLQRFKVHDSVLRRHCCVADKTAVIYPSVKSFFQIFVGTSDAHSNAS